MAENFEAVITTTFRFGIVLLAAMMFVACVEEPPPRSFVEFMDDSLAREGVLARCNADRAATANDPECVNARRAAAAIAAQEDAAKRERLEAQSEARRLAARQRADAQLAAEQQAALDAEAERQMAYEAQFQDSNTVVVSPAAASPAVASPEAALAEPPPTPAAPVESPAAVLEPVTLPSSVRPPLTTISLPRGAKPIEQEPAGPELEEIVLPSRLKTID